MAPTNFACWAFEEEVERLASEKLSGARTSSDVSAVMGELTAFAEEELQRVLEPEGKSRIACRAGCAACCSVNVSVLFPEGIAIADYIRENLAGEGFNALRVCIGRLAESVRWLEDEERIRLRIPCAFLDEHGWCSIHPARPLLCRSLTSTEPAQCRRALDSWAYGEEEPILINLSQKLLMDATFKGLGNALDRLGKDSRSLELMRVVKNFLDKPALVDAFLGGGRISFD